MVPRVRTQDGNTFGVKVGVAERDKREVDNGVQIGLVKGFENLVKPSLICWENAPL